jgi:hypothetical protein
MAVEFKIVEADEDIDAQAWVRLADPGLCGHFSLVMNGRLLLHRQGKDVVEWHPDGFEERLAALPDVNATYDEADRLFDGFDLFVPRVRRGASIDLRPLGLPFERVSPVSVLMNRGDTGLAGKLRQLARFCVRYGTMIRVYY